MDPLISEQISQSVQPHPTLPAMTSRMMGVMGVGGRFEIVDEPNISSRFEVVGEHEGIYQGKPPTLFDKVADYLGLNKLFAKPPKTTPLEISAVETGKTPYQIKEEVFGTGRYEELQRVLQKGLDSASFGAVDAISKMVKGEGIQDPETVLGTIGGAGASLVGFLAGGPFAAAKAITGSRLVPTIPGLRRIAQTMIAGGATLGIASGLSDIIPAFMESESFTEMGEQILKSTAVGGMVGVMFPVMERIPVKPLRMALGLAVMDKIRAGTGEWFTIDDVFQGVVDGTIDKKELADRTFGYLLDLFFLAKVPTMKQQLDTLKINKMVEELGKVNPEEIEQTIMALKNEGLIPGSKERAETFLDEPLKQQTWEEFREGHKFRVALKDEEGHIVIGNPGEIHPELWLRASEILKGNIEDGFVDQNDNYRSRQSTLDAYKLIESQAKAISHYASFGDYDVDIPFVHWRTTEERVAAELRPTEHMGLVHGEEAKTVKEYGLESKGELVVDRVYVYKVGQEKETLIPEGGLYLGRVPRAAILTQEQAKPLQKLAREIIKREGKYAPGDLRAIEEKMYQLARKEGFVGIDVGNGTLKIWADTPVIPVKKTFLDSILIEHEKTDGSTFNVVSGENLVGKAFFAVSIYPKREIIYSGKKITPQQLRDFVVKNADLLTDPKNSIGTWYDKTADKTYLDVAVTIPDKAEAMRLARVHGQKAIYDLGTGNTIDLGPVPSEIKGIQVGVSGYADVGIYKTTLPSAIDLPEIVTLATELMGGKYPEVKERLRIARGMAGGVFYPKEEGKIQIKAGLFKNIEQVRWVIAHEVGHLVDYLPDHLMKRGNILGRIAGLKKNMSDTVAGILGTNEWITEELKLLTHKIKPFDSETVSPGYKKYRYSTPELYADAITTLVNNPGMLKEIAPKFYDAFFTKLHTKPEVERLYDEMQIAIKSGVARAESVAKLREDFQKGDRAQFDLIEKLKGTKEGLGTAFIDKNYYTLSRLTGSEYFKGVRGLLEAWDYRVSEHEAYMNDIYNRVIKPIENSGASYDDYREWVYHQRVINERKEIANPEGWYPKASEERVAEMKVFMPDAVKVFEQTHKDFWALRQEYFIDVAKILNVYDEELMSKIEDTEFYATFQVQDYINKKYGAAAGPKIYKQIGTLSKITDPFAQTVMKDISLMSSLNKIKAVRGIIGAWTNLFPNEIKEADTRWNGKGREIIESSEIGMGLLVDLQEGKAKGFYVPEVISKSFEANPLEGSAIARVLRYTVQPFRVAYTEVNYGFWMFNMVRDYFRAARNLPGNSLVKFFPYWISSQSEGIRSAFGKQVDIAQQMLKEGMLISVADTEGMKPEDKQIERLQKKFHITQTEWDNNVGNDFKKAYTLLTNIGRGFERATKIASYKYLKDNFPNMTQAEVGHEVRSWGGSPDFLRKGTGFPIYNNLLLFSNAMKEGYRADWEVMKESPSTFWWKTAKYQLMPKLLMKAAMLGFLGIATKEIFENMTEYDLTNYFCIPLGKTAQGKGVYLRVPTDETGRLIGGVFWKIIGADVNMVEGGLADYMAGQTPTVVPVFSLLGDVATYYSGHNPYDNFRGRYAIPDLVWKAQDSRTSIAFAKYMANKAGVGVVYRFNTEDDVEIKSTIEKIIGLPILSNILGRFIKVTDYGLKEHVRQDLLKPIEVTRAREILNAHEAISKLVGGKTLSGDDWQAIFNEEVRGSQVVDRTAMVAIGRRFGSAYTEALMSASSIEQKIAIMREIAKKGEQK